MKHPIVTELGLDNLNFESILKAGGHQGAQLVELYFEDRDLFRMTFEDRKVDQVVQGRDRGCGIRILFDQRTVYGYTTDLSQSSLERLASDLAAGVDSKSDKIELGDFDVSKSDPALTAYRPKRFGAAVSMAERVEILNQADRAVRDALPELIQATHILIHTIKKFAVINSDGRFAADQKVYTHFISLIVGKDATSGRVEQSIETDGGYIGFEFFERRSSQEIALEAGRKVKVQLGALPAPRGSLPVILSSEAGGTMVHEAVGHGLEADLACEGLSVYQNKVGQQVASALITVIDDGTMLERRGSYAVDDEGESSQKTTLIENGVLKGYLVDRMSALRFDLPPTGNGRRETFRHVPIVRMTNTYIAPGKSNPEEILRETKHGIFVRSMGGGQVNTVTGDFVFAVDEAYLIRDGKLAEPIRGATLVGNGPQIMQQIDRVGNDLGFATGTCGKDGQGAPVTDAQPTLRIPNMTVGGEVDASQYFAV